MFLTLEAIIQSFKYKDKTVNVDLFLSEYYCPNSVLFFLSLSLSTHSLTNNIQDAKDISFSAIYLEYKKQIMSYEHGRLRGR